MTNPAPTKSHSIPAAARWFAVLAGAGVAVWLAWNWWVVDPAQHLSEAERHLRRGEYSEAENAARTAFMAEQQSNEAFLLAAKSAVGLDEPERAVEYLLQLNAKAKPDLALEASLLAADIQHYETFDFAGAEAFYRKALQLDSDNVAANEGLAKLLAVCGHRQEAIPYVLAIVRQGLPTDLLFILARESGAINDFALLKNAHKAHPDAPRPLLGLARQAEERGEVSEAVRLAEMAAMVTPPLPIAQAELGRYLLLAERYEDLSAWEESLPREVDQFAEAWRVRGHLAEHRSDKAAAIAAFLKAAEIAPESKKITAQLSRLLYQAGKKDWGDRFATHLNNLNHLEAMQDRAIFGGSRSDPLAFVKMIEAYQTIGRIWEAWGWSCIAMEEFPQSAELLSLRSELQQSLPTNVDRLIPDDRNLAMEIEWNGDSLLASGESVGANETQVMRPSAQMSFRNDASDVGMKFRFINGVTGGTQRRMFEFTGGGIGVIDFDGDAFPDLTFTQGRPWDEDDSQTEYRDQLFRNRRGRAYEEISDVAGFGGSGFGQGIAVGDTNSDGFPDIYVANIGRNQLWLNNGDGTFYDASHRVDQHSDTAWTTSCAIADFNGDGWADIYAVNYLEGNDIFDRVCSDANGTQALCSPTQFDGVRDSLLINDGTGAFSDQTVDHLSPVPMGKGLGILVWDATGDGRLSLFIANDTTQNHFFTVDGNDMSKLHDQGFASGLAANRDGKYEGCMGIAINDVNSDGLQDLFVTNFFAESNTLYRALGLTIFEDQSQRFRMDETSLETLAFGTQFLDVDLNGQSELFIANGHVDDLREQGKPWAMLPQLLQLEDDGFHVADAASLGHYFQTEHLGRAAARLDWNRDGRPDLAVGHLWEDAALLTNTTDEIGNALVVSLVGTKSNRDAIGATVTVTIGNRTIVSQITAGDGYQCSNERPLTFGCDLERTDVEMTVRWPSGAQQTFHDISVPAHVVLREGRPTYFSVP